MCEHIIWFYVVKCCLPNILELIYNFLEFRLNDNDNEAKYLVETKEKRFLEMR